MTEFIHHINCREVSLRAAFVAGFFAVGVVGPWWGFAVFAFALGLLFASRSLRFRVEVALCQMVVWVIIAIYFDLHFSGRLSSRLGSLLGVHNSLIFYFAVSLLWFGLSLAMVELGHRLKNLAASIQAD